MSFQIFSINENVSTAFTDIDEILALLSRIDHFASLPSSVDAFDNNNVKMAKKAADIFAWVNAKISFFYSEIQNMPDEYFEQFFHKIPGVPIASINGVGSGLARKASQGLWNRAYECSKRPLVLRFRHIE